ncbi:MAG: regulatory iron-sulfur-containing complex subunit RicT [Acidobacteriota bacterium]|nr:regulatory iron-sulfur-containing complex subunit RicT [Acidobacteriota bacterium]MDQ7087145.1 regulatory iron-sulfur-containing complex subunit RicT [Acidobacteriota bacterium]
MLSIQVEIPGQAKPVTCSTRFEDLGIGDRLLVEIDGKTTFAWVVRVPLELEWGERKPRGKVLRRASRADEERQSHIEARRQEWLEIAREMVLEHGLPMRVLRADLTPSGGKVTFYFVAEGRVDFRALVRDMARRLRARVELRQIGVRDATVLQGGVGHCGQSLCCARFLDGFAPVSMRMAKAQGLPLNPSKISGQCGRLMCCLRYELEGPDQGGKARRKGARRCSGGGCKGGGCAQKRSSRPDPAGPSGGERPPTKPS